MRSKLFFITLALVLIASLALFFLLSDSYKYSFQAKLEYTLGHYDKAQKLAVKAHNEDSYNRMAATVMTQSALALEYVNYIKDGKEYLEKIKVLTQKEYLEKGDKIRMKFMADIMLERYGKLTPTVVIRDTLKQKAHAIYEEFTTIHAKVINAL